MKHTLRQIFRPGKFVFGFAIFMAIVLIVIIYPLIIRERPLEILGQGTFFPPGIYVSVYDSIGSPTYTINLEDAAANRIASKLSDEDRIAMQEWLVAYGIPENEIDIQDTEKLLEQWENNFDPNLKLKGMTYAKRRYYQRVDAAVEGILSTEGATIAVKIPETGALEPKAMVEQSDYVN